MLGARMHYAVPRILQHEGMLQALVTDAYLPGGVQRDILAALARMPVLGAHLKPILGRHHPDLAGATILQRRATALRMRARRLRARDKAEWHAAKRLGARQLAALIARDPAGAGDAVYAFHEAALESFEVARTRGLGTILEQSVLAKPVAARLLAEEIPAWADWFRETGVPILDASSFERSQREWDSADRIIAASGFVRQSLVECGVARSKIALVPYGVDIPARAARMPDYAGDRPLRLLFAGASDLRKGVHHLLRAVDRLGPQAVELRVAGGIGLKAEVVSRFDRTARFLGPVARQDMARQYDWADAFVLPSLVEGSATVTYEALARGLPVITTPNAGSVVTDDGEGRIVAAGSAEALVEALAGYLEDPARLHRHAAGARAARDKVSFPRYARDLTGALADLGRAA
jgi:glycosyltransferase involved in cell wall biosynthesis